MHGMDPRGGPSTGGGSSLVPLAAALGTMAPPGSRTILTRTTQTFVGGAAAPAASFSQLRTLAAQMSSEQTKIAEQAKDASDKLERAEAARKQLEGEVFQLQKQLTSTAAEKAKLLESNAALKHKAEALQTSLHALSAVAAKHEEQVVSCSTAVTVMIKFRDKADAELVSLKKALEEVAQRFEEVSCKERDQSAQLAARLKEVEANLNKSSSDCAGLIKALADARTHKETSVAEVTKTAAEEAAKLEAACKEAAATAARMVEERDSALAHVVTLTSEAVTLKTEADKVAGLNVTLQELTEKRANEMTDLEKLRFDNEKLVADVAELTKKLAAAASDNKKLVTKMISVESTSKTKVSTLTKEADAKATGLQTELDAATAKAEDLKSKLNALENEAAQIQAGMKQHIEAAAEQLTAKAMADAKTEWDAKLQTQIDAAVVEARAQAKADADAVIAAEITRVTDLLKEAENVNTQLKASLASTLSAKDLAVAHLSTLQSTSPQPTAAAAGPVSAPLPAGGANMAPPVNVRVGTSQPQVDENLIGIIGAADSVRKDLDKVFFSTDAVMEHAPLADAPPPEAPTHVPPPPGVSQVAPLVVVAKKSANPFADPAIIPVAPAPSQVVKQDATAAKSRGGKRKGDNNVAPPPPAPAAAAAATSAAKRGKRAAGATASGFASQPAQGASSKLPYAFGRAAFTQQVPVPPPKAPAVADKTRATGMSMASKPVAVSALPDAQEDPWAFIDAN